MPAEDSIYVEFHAWESGSPSYPAPGWLDVTQYVVSTDWTAAVSPPWGGAAITLEVPFPLIGSVMPGRKVDGQAAMYRPQSDGSKKVVIDRPFREQVPETGFWVVLGQTGLSGKKHALGLYRCATIQFAESTGYGALPDTQVIQVSCENFLALLASSRLQLAPAQGTWGQEGFVYDLNSWGVNLTTLLSAVLNEPLGPFFQKLWDYMVRLTLPPSLGSGTMGNQIKVVFDNSTSANFAPMRIGTFQEVIGWVITTPTTPENANSLLSFLMGIFRADSRMVEVFPSMEYTLDSFVAAVSELPDLPDGEVLPAIDTRTALGKTLGASPVIIYRFRPWITEAITAENVKKGLKEDGIARVINSTTACERLGYMQTPTATEPGLSNIAWFDIQADDIEHVSFSWNEADRVNLGYSSNFAAEAGPQAYGYNPPLIKDPEQVSRHGLRVSEYHWPYFPPQNAAATPTNLETVVNKGVSALRTWTADQLRKDPATTRTPLEGAPSFYLEDFRDRQFRPGDVPKQYIPNVQRLARNLEIVQKKLGYVGFVCAYRTPAHNARNFAADPVHVGQSSLHLQALAVDMRVVGMTIPALYLAMLQLIADGPEQGGIEQGQLILYDSDRWVHYAPTGTNLFLDSRVKEARAMIGSQTFTQLTKGALRNRNGISAPSVSFLGAVPSSTPDVLEYTKALTEIGWAMTGESERFCRGTALVSYRPWMQAGHWVRFYRKGYCLSAYIESVNHRVIRDQGGQGGVLMSSTTLAYSRGTLRYYDASFRPPTYQTPLMTLEANAGGAPAKLNIGQAAEKIAEGVKGALSAIGKAANSVLPPAVQVGGQKAFNFVYAPGGILPGAKLATKARAFIIIHQSNTSTVKELVDQLKKPKIRLDDRKKKEVYYQSTNYTVDKDGTIIRWIDPLYYYTDNAVSGLAALPTEQTISVDFIGLLGDTLTENQVHAGALLLQDLSGAPFNIPLAVAPDRTNKEMPIMARSEDGLVYGVFRHRSFSDPWCACCAVNPQALVDYAKANTDLTATVVQGEKAAAYLQTIGVL